MPTATDPAEPRSNLKRDVLTGSLFGLTGQVLSFGLRIVQGVVLARLLSERDFGIIAVSMVLLEFTTLLQGMGLQIAALQKGAEREGVVETAFTIQLALALFTSLFMMLVVAPVWSSLFREPALTAVVRIQALLLLINAAGFVPRVMLQAKLRFGLISSSFLAGNILAALISMGIAWKIQSYWAVVIGYFLGNLLTLIIMLVFSRERWVFGIHSAIARELTRFGVRVLVLHIVALSGYQLDKVFLGALLTMEDVGVYWQAYKWGMLGVIALIPAVQPVFFAAYCHRKEHPDKLHAAYLQSITAASLLMIPTAVGLVAVAPDFVVAFLGSKWEPAVRPMQWLAVVSLPRMLNSLTAPLIQAVGRPELQLRAELWSKLVFVVALLMLCGPFGISGVVVAVAINHGVNQILMSRFTNQLIGAGLGQCLRAMARPAVMSLVILPVVWGAGFIADPFVRCTVAVAGGTFAYAATVMLRYRVGSVAEVRRLLIGEIPL